MKKWRIKEFSRHSEQAIVDMTEWVNKHGFAPGEVMVAPRVWQMCTAARTNFYVLYYSDRELD